MIVAADLLGQAEHGPTSPAVLITTVAGHRRAVCAEVDRAARDVPTADIAAAAWRDHGEIRVVADDEEALALADEYAFEHVEVHSRETRAGTSRGCATTASLFLGETTTVAYGDKTIGTNHILPTRGAARYTGGLWVGKFLKTVHLPGVRRGGERR